MDKITVLGIDLAKHHFQIHGNNSQGKRVLKKTLSPDKAAALIANLPKCLIGMEACGSAHFWARKFRDYGHEVRLIPPQYVRAFVIGNHNDVNDAEGIAEAVSRKNIRFVPIKEESHQDLQNIHRVRQRLMRNKVALSNQIRGILYEYNIKMAQGDASLRKKLVELLDGNQLSELLKRELQELYEEFVSLIEKIKDKDKYLHELAKADVQCKRLMTIPGVGPMISTACVASVANANEFKNGRSMAAWLGIVPGHHHTGGPKRKVVMKGITKRGDRYLRTLFIQGARAWLSQLHRLKGKRAAWAKKLLDAKGFNKAAVAIANKNIRIACMLLKNSDNYNEALAA